jgi:hypothetical protein
MQAGLADRLRIRRSIRRLDRKAPQDIEPAEASVGGRGIGSREFVRGDRDGSGAQRPYGGRFRANPRDGGTKATARKQRFRAKWMNPAIRF